MQKAAGLPDGAASLRPSATRTIPAAARPIRRRSARDAWIDGILRRSVRGVLGGRSRRIRPCSSSADDVAPALRRRVTTVPRTGSYPSRMRDPHVVGMRRDDVPSTTGTPASEPGRFPPHAPTTSTAAPARLPIVPQDGIQSSRAGVDFRSARTPARWYCAGASCLQRVIAPVRPPRRRRGHGDSASWSSCVASRGTSRNPSCIAGANASRSHERNLVSPSTRQRAAAPMPVTAPIADGNRPWRDVHGRGCRSAPRDRRIAFVLDTEPCQCGHVRHPIHLTGH